jgi:hypothetical protein
MKRINRVERTVTVTVTEYLGATRDFRGHGPAVTPCSFVSPAKRRQNARVRDHGCLPTAKTLRLLNTAGLSHDHGHRGTVTIDSGSVLAVIMRPGRLFNIVAHAS